MRWRSASSAVSLGDLTLLDDEEDEEEEDGVDTAGRADDADTEVEEAGVEGAAKAEAAAGGGASEEDKLFERGLASGKERRGAEATGVVGCTPESGSLRCGGGWYD